MEPPITQEQLRDLFEYTPETGVFTYKRSQRGIAVGTVAGTLQKSHHNYKYWKIIIRGKSYRAHRLAWLYVHGVMPETIDHINGDPLDNRLCNLRLATPFQNSSNLRSRKGATGLRGVSYFMNGYQAQISWRDRSVYLGRFKTAEEAHEAWRKAAKRLRGDFAKLD